MRENRFDRLPGKGDYPVFVDVLLSEEVLEDKQELQNTVVKLKESLKTIKEQIKKPEYKLTNKIIYVFSFIMEVDDIEETEAEKDRRLKCLEFLEEFYIEKVKLEYIGREEPYYRVEDIYPFSITKIYMEKNINDL